MKNRIEKQLEVLRQNSFDWIISEIVKYCIKYEWEFSTAWNVKIINKKGEELDATKNYLSNLVFWYEDNFRNFPQIIVDKTGRVLK